MTRIYPFQRTARWLSLGFLAVALLLGGWVTTGAQEEEKTPKLIDRNDQEIDLKNAKPRNFDQIKIIDKNMKGETREKQVQPLSPHHAMLHKLAGHWTAQVRMHLEPGADPVESRGAVRNEMILDGRALRSDFKGQFMGQAFIGFGIDGYDVEKGHHFGFWMDSSTTAASYDTGDCTHDGTDVVTQHGEFKDPQTGEQVERKTILTLRSTTRYTYEEWHTRGDGEPTLAMQIIFSKHQ